MWGSRPGSTDKGIMGRLSLTTTYDHVPSIWLQKNDFYTTEFHQFPTVIEHFSIDLIGNDGFEPILIEDLTNPIGIDKKSIIF